MYQVPCASEAVSDELDPRDVHVPPVKALGEHVTDVAELATITG